MNLRKERLPQPARRRRSQRCDGRAFTLIELLVVVAIIALLISILLPSLSSAREKARRTVCLAHMNQIAKARSMYGLDFDGWLPGPATSGHLLTHGDPFAKIEQDDRSSATAPIQNMDWISPTLGGIMSFPGRDVQRLIQILNTKLCCPSNHEHYDEATDLDAYFDTIGGVRVDQIKYSSYVAAEGFHLLGKNMAVDGRSVTAIKAEVEAPNPSAGLVDFPDHYVPKESKVGNPSMKVYVLEGARALAEDRGNKVSFNVNRYQDEGGNFMVFGPATPKHHDLTVLDGGASAEKLNDYNKRYAWRHEEGMNLVFFDGHAEHRKWKETLSLLLYFPGRTILKSPWMCQDPRAEDLWNVEMP
ncbi:MAG: prepilin-type N-terminal cleavage/methylation domain-containing protein [Phycisphaerae bacterium]|nr:prepilin-type N-terminal cleavage/methylation domain-containing protein [Phycisphaerae bacterium]